MPDSNLVTLDVTKIDSLARPTFALPQKSFDDLYMLSRPQKRSLRSKLHHYCQSQNLCSGTILWQILLKRIPVLNWLFKYDLKNSLPSDVLGGITVGIMQIPQGMAYALLANLPPVYGLYVSFFSVFVYFFLGTSRHLSLGTFAVVSLMTGKIVNNYINKQPHLLIENKSSHSPMSNAIFTNGSDTLLNGTMMAAIHPDADLVGLKVQIAVAVASFVGILQILMGVLQLGTLSVYLSDMLVSGFTTGAAVHVFTSQVKYMFGINVSSYGGILAVLYTYMDILHNIHLTNYLALGISASVIVSLVFVNDCINAKFKEKMLMPIPMELLVIVVTTLASYYFNLNKNYNIQIVNDIPIGIPPPAIPRIDAMPDIAVDCIALAIVSYCIPISLAKIFAKRKKYDIDPNQELFAYGVGNVVGAFFSCFPSCASLSRSSVQETSGAKTQVASLVSCGLILIVLLLIAPLFEPVPNCVLASIIVVALRGMFRQVNDLKSAWFISKREVAIWLVSFTAVVTLDVDIGLLVSISFLLIMVLYRLQRPYATELGNVPATDIYLDMHKYRVTKPIMGIKIIHFGGALYFANREYFKQECNKLLFKKQKYPAIPKDTDRRKTSIKSVDGGHLKSTISQNDLIVDSKNSNISTPVQPSLEPDFGNNSLPPHLPSALIIDCSVMSFIDMSAITTLSQVYSDYEEKRIQIYLCACNDNVLMKLERTKLFEEIKSNIFPTVHDAVMHINSTQMDYSKSSPDSNTLTHL